MVGERWLDLVESINFGFFIPSAMRSADAVSGSKCKSSGDFSTNMMNESWHDGKTANDDAYSELGPSPKTHNFQVMGFVS